MNQDKNRKTDSAWARANVNLRLSKRRLEQLKSLSKDLSDSATPTDVIDHALRISLAGDKPIQELLLDMEDAAEQRDMQQRFEFDRLDASIARMAESVKALHALISVVACDEET